MANAPNELAAQRQIEHMTLSNPLYFAFATLITIPFFWPLIALVIKRVHDFNHGWEIHGPWLLLNFVGLGLSATGYESYALHVTLHSALSSRTTLCVTTERLAYLPGP